MVAALGSASPAIRGQWIDTVENPDKGRSWGTLPAARNGGSRARSPDRGNLAVLAALLGTPRAPRLAGQILFIEDVGERPYRIDRVLTTMKQAGFFEGLAGLIVGAFTEGDPDPTGFPSTRSSRSISERPPFPCSSDSRPGTSRKTNRSPSVPRLHRGRSPHRESNVLPPARPHLKSRRQRLRHSPAAGGCATIPHPTDP